MLVLLAGNGQEDNLIDITFEIEGVMSVTNVVVKSIFFITEFIPAHLVFVILMLSILNSDVVLLLNRNLKLEVEGNRPVGEIGFQVVFTGMETDS